MTVTHKKREAILIFGMHRSGTSATTRVVNLLGADLNAEILGPGFDNAKGFWESARAVDLHERLFKSLKRTWYDMLKLPVDWTKHPAARKAVREIKQLITEDFSDSALWAIKDPRMCLLAPLWIEALGALEIEAKALFVVRNPLEVAESLRTRNQWSRGHAALMWAQYLVEPLVATHDVTRAMISYDELLEDWRATMTRVGKDLRIAWPRGLDEAAAQVDHFLDEGERHHSVPVDLAKADESGLPDLVDRIYAESLSIIKGGSDWGQLNGLAEEFHDAMNLYGPAMEDVVGRYVAAEKRAGTAEARAGEAEHRLAAEETVASAIRESTSTIRENTSTIRENSGAIESIRHQLTIESGRLTELEERFEARIDALDQRLARHLDEAALQNGRLLDAMATHFNAVESRQVAMDAELSKVNSLFLSEIAQRDEALENILNSRSWKITAPLRSVRKGMRRLSIRGYAGRAAKRTYRALPLSPQSRLALKDAIFRALSPVLKNTQSYRAWRAFRAHRGLVEFGAAPDGPANAVASNSADAYLQEVFGKADASVYVPICDAPLKYDQIDTRVIAFYLPQFHPIPENDAWWGRGFTEWTNVSKAVPQFVGHYQPRLPGELGFYDLRLVEVMKRQVELAQLYGVQGFCFHYYWFGGRRLLERPLEQFVAAKDIDFPFCICWANENWTRRWDGQDSEVLMAQNHSPEDDISFIRELAPLLRDSRYIRVGGKPLVVMYRPSILPDAAATLERWRGYCREAGIGELFICMVQFDVEDPRVFGFDAAIEFPPHKLASGLAPINESLDVLNPDYSGYVIDYKSVMDRARDYVANGFDVIRGVFPSWDNEARKPGRGYTFAHASPRRYGEWLRFAIDYARKHPVQGERLVFVNAWNEWAEGAHLEPDRKYGYAYLQETRDALTLGGSVEDRKHIVVVTHDAHPHGAQYLALHMVRELHEVFGFDVDVVILGEGILEERFALYGKVHKLVGVDHRGTEATDLAWLLAERSQHAIANTTVAGLFAQTLSKAGMHVVSLVHELPGIIKGYGLQPHITAMANSVRKIVFPAATVREGFRQFGEINEQRVMLRPQGLFARSRYRGLINRSEPRLRLRERLGLGSEDLVVLAIGYADHRKGIDLFADMGLRILKEIPNVHFVWVGHFDASIETGIRAEIADSGHAGHFHFPGLDFDTDDYYAGADAYALTSREDPFPSVVLEALSVGTPVVAFAGSGGAEEILRKGCGVLVDRTDAKAFADALRGVLMQPEFAARLGQVGRELVQKEYSFRSYMFDLLDAVGLPQPRISVIVPNYNYARYMPERLSSIDDQSVPIYELLVLDDASTDNSLEALDTLRRSLRTEFTVIPNERNSGSVFKQWKKGVELAKGEFVWIAEADDTADKAFLAATMRPMMIDPDVVMSYSESWQLDENGRLIADNYRDYCRSLDEHIWGESYIARGVDEVRRALSIKNTIPNVSAVVFRRDVIARVLEESMDEVLKYKIAGDWVTYLGVLEHGNIAFCAESHNGHRRHSRSVTLGSDRLPHLLEVLKVQKMARDKYAPDSRQVDQALAYAQHVYVHLGLASDEVPSVEMCAAAQPWLRD